MKTTKTRFLVLAATSAVLVIALAGGIAWKLLARKPLPTETNSIGMSFVLVPAGKFLMGSPPSERGRDDDEPQHEVAVTAPFLIGIHEVTQQQYERVMGSNPSILRRDELPVENVSYDEAIAFCRKLSDLPEEKSAGRSYRLPTECEWEYACRAGTKSAYGVGKKLERTQANTLESQEKRGDQRLDPVGSYPPNAWGIHDMHGNVCEWCSDWYDGGYYADSPHDDPTGPESGTRRVARGGSCATTPEDCRSANRIGLGPAIRSGMGLRVVMVKNAV